MIYFLSHKDIQNQELELKISDELKKYPKFIYLASRQSIKVVRQKTSCLSPLLVSYDETVDFSANLYHITEFIQKTCPKTLLNPQRCYMLRAMDNKKRISNLAEEKYLVLFGVHKATFDAMLSILEEAYEQMRQKGGRKRKLSVLDMLIIMLGYYHDYRTMENIAFDYGVHKQRISEAVAWVEQTLIKDGTFSLPSKRELLKSDTEIVVVIVDVTECETERPKKNKKNHTPANKNVIQ